MTPVERALIYGPSDETRAAACENADTAYQYADDVDHGPRDDTRKAACGDAVSAYFYACNIDKTARDDTWEASKNNGGYNDYNDYQTWYIDDVPGAIKLYFKDWLMKNRDNYIAIDYFCRQKTLSKKQHKMIRELDIDAAVIYILSIRGM